jgi:hypothetical protein
VTGIRWTLAVFALGSAATVAGGPEPPEWRSEARLFGQIHESMWDFGHSVDISGDVAIVGAPQATLGGNARQGAAYVFRLELGGWVEEAMLTASDGTEEDFFGWAVAVEGDVAIVAAAVAGEGADLFRGAAYYFEREPKGWVERQKILSSDGDEQDRFGFSLVLEGDRLVVGARNAGPGADVGGAAYVFEREAGVWVEQQKLFDPTLGTGDAFGYSVGLNDDTIVVGDNIQDSSGSNSGAVYVYTLEGEEWTEEQKLVASDAGPTSRFGTDVSIDGDRLLVGANQHDEMNNNQGAAYIFTRSAGVWTEQQRLLASNGHENAYFGTAVELSGRVALVGAELDILNQNNRGVVYEYRLEDGSWDEIQWFTAPIGQGLDSFGEDIEMEGKRVIIGNSDNISVSPSGTAWIFLRPLLFEDGFESGDTSAWSGTVP